MSDRLLLHLQQIEAAAADACRFTKGMDQEAFGTDLLVQRAVGMSILMLGEAAVRIIKENADFVVDHPEIPWNEISGLRNRIAHGYFTIDLDIIWHTVQVSLPDLLDKLQAATHWRAQGE